MVCYLTVRHVFPQTSHCLLSWTATLTDGKLPSQIPTIILLIYSLEPSDNRLKLKNHEPEIELLTAKNMDKIE